MKCYDGWRGLNVISKADHTTAKCTAKVEKGKREANDEMKSWSESVRWLEKKSTVGSICRAGKSFCPEWNSENQWRRQRSKRARSFRGQKILQPGHPDALFSQKVYYLFSRQSGARAFLVVALKTQAANSEAKQCRARQGIARAVALPARLFDRAPWCSSATGDKVVAAGSRDHENDTVFELFTKRCSKVKERE